jgi:TolB-like protein
MNFFAELKRRNVFKVAAAYIIVGWLIMQAGEVMSPALRLPEWVNSTLAFFLILGFPVALVFAWAFEMTPDGLKKEKEVDRSQSITPVTGQKLNYTIIALMAVALTYFAYDKFVATPEISRELAQAPEKSETVVTADVSQVQKPNRKSIAVIPFQNRSANEENAEFFSDGVHDELLTNLSKIGDLKVISRTSVMSYRDTTKNIQQIATELGVANILEGGVQRAGDTVRINVQLIDAESDEHIWAEIYDRQLSAENIFAIQTEIARAIANALEATLSPREQELLATQPTKNLEALDNFLIGSQLLEQSNWQSYRDAQIYLRKAIELDPQFVQAYVYLAISYFSLLDTGAITLPGHKPYKLHYHWIRATQPPMPPRHFSCGKMAWRGQRKPSQRPSAWSLTTPTLSSCMVPTCEKLFAPTRPCRFTRRPGTWTRFRWMSCSVWQEFTKLAMKSARPWSCWPGSVRSSPPVQLELDRLRVST